MLMACGRAGLGDSSEENVEIRKEIIENSSDYLRSWAKKFEKIHVNEVHDIPNP